MGVAERDIEGWLRADEALHFFPGLFQLRYGWVGGLKERQETPSADTRSAFAQGEGVAADTAPTGQ